MSIIGSSNLGLEDRRAIITRTTILDMHRTFKGDLFCTLCRNVLLRKLLETGVAVRRGSKSELLPSVWSRLVGDVVDTILCLGICPVQYSASGPRVPAVGTYEIWMLTRNGEETVYEVHDDASKDSAAANVVVFAGHGYDPTVFGNLTSILQTMIPLIHFVAELHDCAMTAETLRSNPPLITERQDVNESKHEGMHFDYFADADAARSNMHSTYQRDQSAIEQLQRQKRLFASALGVGPKDETTTTRAMDNVVPLPTGYKHATTLSPSSRTDFVSVNRLYQETIAGLIGVPRSLVITDSNVKSNEHTHEIFRQTLLWWRRTLQEMMTSVYRSIYAKTEAKRMATIAKKRKRVDLNGIVDKNLPCVYFPLVPYLEPDRLQLLYSQEIISFETYAKYMLRLSHLPEEDLNTKKDPWSHDEHLLMQGQKVSPKSSEEEEESVSNKSKTVESSPQT